MFSLCHRIQGRLVRQTSDVVEAVCRMAQEHKQQGHLSMVAILEKSGYSKHSAEITEAALEQYLRQHPELFDTWLLHSMDHRASPAWYFKSASGDSNQQEARQLLEDPGQVWIVGRQPGGQAREFRDGYRACAVYVKKRAERLKVLSERGGP